MVKYVLVLMFSLFLVACTPVTPFEAGQQEYVSGNYLRAAQIFSEHTSWNSDIKYEAMYYEGMCWANLQSNDKAMKLFTVVIEHSKNRAIKAKAIAAKADLSLAQGDCSRAISLYKMLLLAGYVDYYPQEEAYLLLKKAAIQCGNTDILKEYDERFGADTASAKTATGGLKRVRLESQFSSKTEALTVMKGLDDAGVDSSLIRVSSSSGDIFVVQLGAFSNVQNAENLAQKVIDLGWNTVIID